MSGDKTGHVAYIEHFLSNYPTRTKKALELVSTIEKYSSQYNINPVVVVVTMAMESSFKMRCVGFAKNEVGLMQVHGVCATGHNLDSADGQIHAGIACLAMARDACDGSVKQMLTMYASGSCKPRTKRTAALIKRRLRIIERWSE